MSGARPAGSGSSRETIHYGFNKGSLEFLIGFVFVVAHFFLAHFYIGVFACIIALIVSLTRILSGVHHISDVFVAIIIAILCFIIDFH